MIASEFANLDRKGISNRESSFQVARISVLILSSHGSWSRIGTVTVRPVRIPAPDSAAGRPRLEIQGAQVQILVGSAATFV